MNTNHLFLDFTHNFKIRCAVERVTAQQQQFDEILGEMATLAKRYCDLQEMLTATRNSWDEILGGMNGHE
mgnify:CR=1 FL=1|jgi:hypothetical protein